MVDLKKEKSRDTQATKLQKVANITYEEAKYVLSKNDGDLLDSLSFLEKNGRIKNSKVSHYNTKDYNTSNINDTRNNEKNNNMKNNNGKNIYSSQKISRGINDIFDKGGRNYFEIHKEYMEPIRVPLVAFIILLLAAFGFVVPLIIIGMFFDITYKFTGKDINENDNINSFLKKCAYNIQEYKNKRRGHKR